MPNDYDTWLQSFTLEMVGVNGIQTAVYAAPVTDEQAPAVLFVHGLNGDYHGLVPVAYELRNDYRVVFVDLPGHGGTAIVHGDNLLSVVQEWAQKLPNALRARGFAATAVVGHSFGAYIAQETALPTLGLLNPPFASTTLSHTSTLVLGRVASVLGKFYSSYPAMIRRGHWLMHQRTKETDMIIAWSSHLTHVTKDQFKFQTRLADAISSRTLMDISRLASVPNVLVVMAKYDRIVDNTTAPLDLLPRARFVTLPTDHVSIFEMPAKVADEIRRIL